MNDSTTYSESDELKVEGSPKKEPPNKVIPQPQAEVDDTEEEVQQTEPIIVKKVAETVSDKPKVPYLAVAKRCDLGAVRERNEDSCLTFASEAGGHFALIPFGLFIVADGMGGHADGHIASSVASRISAKHILNQVYLPMLHSTDPVNQMPIQEVLNSAVQTANTAVFENNPEIDSGTTLTIALILGRRLHVAHVGDSRLYLHTEGRFEAITNDHSLVQRLQDVGQLTAEEAAMYRYRNVLLKAVGQGEEVEADNYMKLLPKKGKLLLCSDGLCGFVSDEIIREIMDQDIPLQDMANALYDAAMAAGGYDNITAVLVEFAL